MPAKRTVKVRRREATNDRVKTSKARASMGFSDLFKGSLVGDGEIWLPVASGDE
jgi:hypothetical protein